MKPEYCLIASLCLTAYYYKESIISYIYPPILGLFILLSSFMASYKHVDKIKLAIPNEHKLMALQQKAKASVISVLKEPKKVTSQVINTVLPLVRSRATEILNYLADEPKAAPIINPKPQNKNSFFTKEVNNTIIWGSSLALTAAGTWFLLKYVIYDRGKANFEKQVRFRSINKLVNNEDSLQEIKPSIVQALSRFALRVQKAIDEKAILPMLVICGAHTDTLGIILANILNFPYNSAQVNADNELLVGSMIDELERKYSTEKEIIFIDNALPLINALERIYSNNNIEIIEKITQLQKRYIFVFNTDVQCDCTFVTEKIDIQ